MENNNPQQQPRNLEPLPGGGLTARLQVGADEIASLPRCVYDVSRDFVAGEITESGREGFAMILLVLTDLLPKDSVLIHAINSPN